MNFGDQQQKEIKPMKETSNSRGEISAVSDKLQTDL